MFADDVDYSQIPYVGRSRTETIASHLGVVVAAPILLWATATFLPDLTISWPVIGALYDGFGYAAPFILSAVVAFLALIAAMIMIPETRSSEIRNREMLLSDSPFDTKPDERGCRLIA